jgi:hypothetical protein
MPALRLAALLWAPPAAAQTNGGRDYDPRSTAWNGLSRLLEVAREEGVRLEPVDVVRFRDLGPGDALLVVYPQGGVPEGDILRLLRRGGRVAIADDFGTAAPLFAALHVERHDTAPVTRDSLHSNPELPIARPRAAHALTQGVDGLVTNHPAFLRGTGEAPVEPAFDFGAPDRAAVIAGRVHAGHVVLLSDPSILINNMLEHGGNRVFAQNLLRHLGTDGGRVVLAVGEFASIGTLGGPAAFSPPDLLPEFNSFLAGLAGARPPRGVLELCGLLSVLAMLLGIALTVPLAGHRYDGRWLRPGYHSAAAGFLGKVQIFRGKRASYLYPALVLRRDLEVRLVEALGLRPPVTVEAILDALARRGVDAGARSDLRRLLVDLDRLQIRADRGSTPPRVSAGRLAGLARTAERMLRLAAGMKTRGDGAPGDEER